MVVAKIPHVIPEFITSWKGLVKCFCKNSSATILALSEGDQVEVKLSPPNSFFEIVALSGTSRANRNKFGVLPAEEVPEKILRKLKRGEEVDITEDVISELKA